MDRDGLQKLHAIINDASGELQQAALRELKEWRRLEQERKRREAAERNETIAWYQGIANDNITYMVRASQDAVLQAILRFENGIRETIRYSKGPGVTPFTLRLIYVVLSIIMGMAWLLGRLL